MPTIDHALGILSWTCALGSDTEYWARLTRGLLISDGGVIFKASSQYVSY